MSYNRKIFSERFLKKVFKEVGLEYDYDKLIVYEDGDKKFFLLDDYVLTVLGNSSFEIRYYSYHWKSMPKETFLYSSNFGNQSQYPDYFAKLRFTLVEGFKILKDYVGIPNKLHKFKHKFQFISK